MRTDKILATAEFDPRLPKYFLLQSSLGMLFGFFTIPLLPFWVLWIGRKVHRKQYEAMSAELTERSLNINLGYIFKVQKNIPLDKITDLAVNEGPILRYLGLCSLQIETAGGGGAGQMGHAVLPGVVDALEFRDRVLQQRDLVSGLVSPATAQVAAEPEPSAVSEVPASQEVLEDIRDTLHKIEGHLSRE